MKKNNRLRILTYAVIAYMLLAFTWWSVLLFAKNQDAFQAKAELLRIGMVAEGLYTDEASFQAGNNYIELKQKYQRQVYMILGESGAFVITLIIGVWLINRGYNQEMQAIQQGRNFLLSITHELKSPIASIRLVLETLRKRQLPPEQIDRLSQSGLKETERLHRLVNDLLFSAKLEMAYQPYFESIDLGALLETEVDRFREKYPQGTFHLNIEPDLPLLKLDESGITSVVLNLLENAVKYSEGPPEVQIQLLRKHQLIQLEVADRGIGIPAREKNRIFDKFYRVGNEDTRKTKGTGLGLYIVQQIIQAHQG
ncbi:MAG: sensor histidine kinase, partial [Phaeodactylibacter sp.]|nr:sensor histidine kinase [Phaeodactylibacter sp.]